MVYRSMAKPEGILEYVLVKVGKFIFPVDFVMIDIVEDKQIPLLLGRPFLATGVTLIDVEKGELTLRVGTEEVHFNLRKSLKQHDVEPTQCMQFDNVTPGCKEQNYDLMKDNSFDDYISYSFCTDEFENKELIAKTILSINERSTENLNIEEQFQVEEKSSEGLVVKELPKHLKHAFLREERSKTVILASKFIAKKE